VGLAPLAPWVRNRPYPLRTGQIPTGDGPRFNGNLRISTVQNTIKRSVHSQQTGKRSRNHAFGGVGEASAGGARR
jgi:hypothetical protein